MDDNPGMIDPFMAEHKLTLTVLPAYNYVNDTLRVNAIPQNWIVGPDGVIRLKGKGYDSTEKWEQGMMDAIEKVGSSGANPPTPPATGTTIPSGSSMESSRSSVLRGFWTQLECAGINRREVANARVVQVRRSEPTWPRVMRGQSQGCT